MSEWYALPGTSGTLIHSGCTLALSSWFPRLPVGGLRPGLDVGGWGFRGGLRDV